MIMNNMMKSILQVCDLQVSPVGRGSQHIGWGQEDGRLDEVTNEAFYGL